MEAKNHVEVTREAMAMQDAIDWPEEYADTPERTRRAFLRGLEMARKVR